MAEPTDNKLSLWDQLLFLDSEIGGVDVWEDVYRSEGKSLPAGMARRRFCLERVRATIELFLAHRDEFVAVIKKHRRVPQRDAKASPPAAVEDETVVVPDEVAAED
jgi:hypothetical protein